jgi:acetoin utilization protein AcuB
MRHTKRAILRETRTRKPKRPDRESAEIEATVWPEATMRVKEVMTRPPVSVRQDVTVGTAWKLMRNRRIRHLPVLDAVGRLIGIVSDRDLRQVILEPALQEQLGNATRAMNVLTIKEVMTWGAVTVRPETELRQAARIMHDQRIGGLPVVDGQRLVGMLTGSDLAQALVRIIDEGVVSKPVRWGREA